MPGTEGIVCLGFENQMTAWPDHTYVFNQDWIINNEIVDVNTWVNPPQVVVTQKGNSTVNQSAQNNNY
jgi:hypothetical protein